MYNFYSTTIGDIYTPRDQIKCFEDRQIEQDAIDFCEKLKISFLPSRNNRGVFYKYISEKKIFEKIEKIEPNYFITINSLLFSDNTIKQFEDNYGSSDNVLFVVNEKFNSSRHQKIIGIVHIVDYEKEFIHTEIYRLFYKFENKIKNILDAEFIGSPQEKLNQFNDYIQSQRKGEKVYEPTKDIGEINPFDKSNFSILLRYFEYKKIIKKNQREAIVELRNHIMHNKGIIDIEGNKNALNENIYNIRSLKKFVSNTQVFFLVLEQFLEL